MQHEPDAVGPVQADLGEVVAGAEGSQVLAVVGLQPRVLVGDRLEATGERLPGLVGGLRSRARRRGRGGRRSCRGYRSRMARRPCRLSGRSAATSEVRAAIIPQPISTPTAAGMIAPRVGITLPMVEPLAQVYVRHHRQVLEDEGHLRRVFSNCWRAFLHRDAPSRA